MKSKIITSLLSVLLILMFAMQTNAKIDSCTLNNPAARQYDNGQIKLNVTAIWSGNGVAGFNVTNATITIGTTTYSNSTVNGSQTNTSGSQSVGKGDFTFTVNASDVLSDGARTTYATCWNSTNAAATDNSLNSTSITYTVDTQSPIITIQQPAQGETVSAKGTGKVLIDYTPTDTNLGNSSYYINGVLQSSSISGTTSPNITSGSRKNTFTKFFGTNNNTITLIVEITDLAGRKTNSSTTTFNVFREGSAEPAKVFVTPSGEVISSPATPKGKAITKTPLSFGNIGNAGNLLSNPFVWGGAILAAVGLFIWWQNRKR